MQGLQTQAITVVSGTVDLVFSPPPPVLPAQSSASAPQAPLVGPPVVVVGAPVPVPVPVPVVVGVPTINIPESGRGISPKVFYVTFPLTAVALLLLMAAGIWYWKKRASSISRKEADKYFNHGRKAIPTTPVTSPSPALHRVNSNGFSTDMSHPVPPPTPEPSPEGTHRGNRTPGRSNGMSERAIRTARNPATSPWDRLQQAEAASARLSSDGAASAKPR
eukprot:jgi/Botrbrau1/20462/Bobra.145_2s0024.1